MHPPDPIEVPKAMMLGSPLQGRLPKAGLGLLLLALFRTLCCQPNNQAYLQAQSPTPRSCSDRAAVTLDLMRGEIGVQYTLCLSSNSCNAENDHRSINTSPSHMTRKHSSFPSPPSRCPSRHHFPHTMPPILTQTFSTHHAWICF